MSLAHEGHGSDRALVPMFSPSSPMVGETFSVEARGSWNGSDVCRLTLSSGPTTGFVACGSLSLTDSFSLPGDKAIVGEIRTSLGQTVWVGAWTVAVASPAPSPSPTPLDVKVVNVPDVNVKPTPLPVRWKGCDPDTGECPSGGVGSWTDDDAQHLAETHELVGTIGGVVAFAAGVGLVLWLPRRS